MLWLANYVHMQCILCVHESWRCLNIVHRRTKSSSWKFSILLWSFSLSCSPPLAQENFIIYSTNNEENWYGRSVKCSCNHGKSNWVHRSFNSTQIKPLVWLQNFAWHCIWCHAQHTSECCESSPTLLFQWDDYITTSCWGKAKSNAMDTWYAFKFLQNDSCVQFWFAHVYVI